MDIIGEYMLSKNKILSADWQGRLGRPRKREIGRGNIIWCASV